MHHQAGGDTAHADAGQLLIGNPAVPDIDALPGAAKLLRVAQAQQTHRRRPGPQLDGNMSRFVPVLGMGHDLGIDETTKLGAPRLVFGSEIGVGQAGAVKIQ